MSTRNDEIVPNRLSKCWPISSTRISDIPNNNRKHRRRVRKKVPKNQPLINTFFARSSLPNNTSGDNNSTDLRRSLFANVKVEPNQTLIDDFLVHCSLKDIDGSRKMSKEDDDVSSPPKSSKNAWNVSHHHAPSSSSENSLYEEEASAVQIKPMAHSTELTFHSFLEENEWEKAVDYISMMRFHKPSVSVLQSVLHIILLNRKSKKEEESEKEGSESESTEKEKFPAVEDPRIFSKAGVYLDEMLELYPPNNTVSIDYYQSILFDYNKHERVGWSKWDTVLDIIKCCKKKCGYSLVQCESNCLDFLKYLVLVFQKEYDAFISARPSSPSPTKQKQCPKLIRNLMWADREPNSSSRVVRHLIKEIDTIFCREVTNPLQMEYLDCLLTLVCLSAECTRLYDNMTEEDAISDNQSAALREIYQCFCNSENIQQNTENVMMFIDSIEVMWFRIAVCQSFLTDMCYASWNADIRREPLTLRKIVFNYMFVSPEVLFPCDDDDFECQPSCRMKNKINIKRSSQGKTPLHLMAAAGLGGRMMVSLEKNPDLYQLVNFVDRNGWTPLHEACHKNAFICVRLLLESDKKGGPVCDVFAADKNGLIPLHLAVCGGKTLLVKLLLDMGDGPKQMKTKNNQGITPLDLVDSKEMKVAFERCYNSARSEFRPQGQGDDEIPEEISRLLQKGIIKEFESAAKYELYLCCLQLFIGNFLAFYDIMELHHRCKDPSTEISGAVKSHLQENLRFECSAANMTDNLLILKHLKSIVSTFCERIKASQELYLGHFNEQNSDMAALKYYVDCI